ncbi:MAG: hypothetical protein WBZ33_02670 [Thermoactinomyces sp.]
MWDHLPDPLPFFYDLECPECKKPFKLTERDPIQMEISCPKCGHQGSLHDFITQDAILYELTLARKKLEKVFFQAKRTTGNDNKKKDG